MRSPEFVVHGTNSSQGAESIENEGFSTKEGFPNVSENLIYAFKWATDRNLTKDRPRTNEQIGSEAEGRILLLRVPEGLKVGYGYNTEIHVDTENREVTGHTKNYISGRNQLAFWNETPKNQTEKSKISAGPENVVLSIRPTEELGSELDTLKHDIRSLEGVSIEKHAQNISDILAKDPENKYSSQELLPAVEMLVESTIKSEVVNMVRSLYIKTLGEKGYDISNNSETFEDNNPMSSEELKHRLSTLIAKSESADFGSKMGGVNRYIRASAKYLMEQLEK
jgi:hypothetical protein